MEEYTIDQTQGKAVRLCKDETITIEDVKGAQVADFFAVTTEDEAEFLSTGVTIDCNASIALRTGFDIYTNRFNRMFHVIEDDVAVHNLLHPCCRPEMYDFFYDNGKGHHNCFDNINDALAHRDIGRFNLIQPVNLFMNTKINPYTGAVTIEKPVSNSGDKITLAAKMDAIVAVAACSVSESVCNGGHPTPIKLKVARH